jgi:hypothetical protein
MRTALKFSLEVLISLVAIILVDKGWNASKALFNKS